MLSLSSSTRMRHVTIRRTHQVNIDFILNMNFFNFIFDCAIIYSMHTLSYYNINTIRLQYHCYKYRYYVIISSVLCYLDENNLMYLFIFVFKQNDYPRKINHTIFCNITFSRFYFDNIVHPIERW